MVQASFQDAVLFAVRLSGVETPGYSRASPGRVLIFGRLYSSEVPLQSVWFHPQ